MDICYKNINCINYVTVTFFMVNSISILDNSCRRDMQGQNYDGTMNQSYSGKECLRWDSQAVLASLRGQHLLFPSGDHTAASNYCRNPDGNTFGPWCFVDGTDSGMHVAKELCDITFCGTYINIHMIRVNVASGLIKSLEISLGSECRILHAILRKPSSWRIHSVVLPPIECDICIMLNE